MTLGHNGNLTNAERAARRARAEGVRSPTTSDTEVIAALIANDPAPLEEAVADAMRRLEGAFTVVALAEGKLVGFRDPHGFRRSTSAASTATRCSPPRRARSTSSAPSTSARSRRASSS